MAKPKIRNAFELINVLYDTLKEETTEYADECETKISELKESIEPYKERFERFFKWENVTFKPFEELDQTNSDEILRKAITSNEKIARFKAINAYIETDYIGSSLFLTMQAFSNTYLALISDDASGEAIENYDSEYYPTSLGTFKTTAKGLPLLIPDPRKAHNELIKHFDRTTILGLLARNAIRDGYIYDTSCLYRLIAIAAFFIVLNDHKLDEEKLKSINFDFIMNDKAFFNDNIRSYFEIYQDSYITHGDNQTVKAFKQSIIESLTSFSQAIATMVVVDFSFFFPFIVTRYIINSKPDLESDMNLLKSFKEASEAMYSEMLTYNTYIVNIA